MSERTVSIAEAKAHLSELIAAGEEISVFLVIVGAVVNAEAERQTVRDSTVGPERPLGEPGAVVADSAPPYPGEEVRPRLNTAATQLRWRWEYEGHDTPDQSYRMNSMSWYVGSGQGSSAT